MALRRRVNKGRFVRVVGGPHSGHTAIVTGDLSAGCVFVHLILGNNSVSPNRILMKIDEIRVAPRTNIHNRRIGKAILKGIARDIKKYEESL